MSNTTTQREASERGDDLDPLTQFVDTFSFDVADAISMANGDHDFLLKELLFRLFSNDRYDLASVADAVNTCDNLQLAQRLQTVASRG